MSKWLIRNILDRKKSKFVEMFGDISNNEYGYKILALGQLCDVVRGGSPRPINDYITSDDDGINWIKIGDAEKDSRYITHTAEKIKPEGIKKTRYVKVGDFILSNSMSFGHPYILKINGCIHDGWLLLKYDKNKLNELYFYEYLCLPAVYQQMADMAGGMVVDNLNSEIIKKLPIMVPPIERQKEFASYVKSIDKLKFIKWIMQILLQ